MWFDLALKQEQDQTFFSTLSAGESLNFKRIEKSVGIRASLNKQMPYIPAYFVIQSSILSFEIKKNHDYFALFLFIAHNICDNGIVRSRFACQKSSFISKITLFATLKNQIETRIIVRSTFFAATFIAITRLCLKL